MTESSDVSPSVLRSEYILECSVFHSPSEAVFVPAEYLDQCNLWGGRFCSQWLLFLLIPQEAHSRAVLILSRNQQSTEKGLGLDVREIRRKINQWKENVASVAVTLHCRRYNLSNCDIYIHVYTTVVRKKKQLEKICVVNLLKTKRNLIYISNQSVPRCKHFPPRL